MAKHLTPGQAICFYSNQSNLDWYKVDLVMYVEKRYPDRIDFESRDKVSFHISKDLENFQCYDVRINSGRDGYTLHWAKTIDELVKDITQMHQIGPQYKVISLADYQRLRQVALAIIERYQDRSLTVDDLTDAFDFSPDSSAARLPGEQRKLKGGEHE